MDVTWELGDDHVGVITLDRPEARNALTHPMYAELERLVRAATGIAPRAVRFLHTDEGLVVFLTLALDPEESLAAAHSTASAVEGQIRAHRVGIADVIVHTEP